MTARVKQLVVDNHLLFLILFFGLYLRLTYYMGVLRGDDISYAYFAYGIAEGHINQSIVDLVRNAPHAGIDRPGLYLPAALLIKLFGAEEFVLTLFPLISSLITIVLIFRIGQMLFGGAAGFLAAFFWAVFPLAVFLDTQLDPESVLAMTTSGAVYYSLRGFSKPSWSSRLPNFLLSILFVCWALLVKLSATPIVLGILTMSVYRFWPEIKQNNKTVLKTNGRLVKILTLLALIMLLLAGGVLTRQTWPIAINNLELTSYDIAPAILLGRSNPVQMHDLGGVGYWVVDRPVVHPPTQAETLTEPTGSSRFKSLDAFVPVFLFAIVYSFRHKKKELYLPILWFGILFFYLEWGTFPRSFSLREIFTYLPITHWIALDNLLYICVPLILVIAGFLALGLNLRSASRAIIVAVIAVTVTAIGMENPESREMAISYLGASLIITIALTAIGTFALITKKPNMHMSTICFALLVPLIGLASLIPSKHYHVWDFVKEQTRRENYRAAIAYLDQHPNLSIFADHSEARLLNLYSGFRFGYAFFKGEGSEFSEARITDNEGVIQEVGGYYLNRGCGKQIDSLLEWPVAEFGLIESNECISLIQYIPLERAIEEMMAAKQNAFASPSLESVQAYVNAAANANNVEEFITALSLMGSSFPEAVPIVQAQGILSSGAEESKDDKVIDLLAVAYSGNYEGWAFGPLLSPNAVEEEGQPVFSVQIEGMADEPQSVVVEVSLKPGTAYALEVELKSSAPFDLVRFRGQNIPDSYPNSWNKELGWKEEVIVFVTPLSNQESLDVWLEIARITDKGDIRFRVLRLVEIIP